MSKNVKYIGDLYAELPSLGLAVNNGDVITVPDDFDNAAFQLVNVVEPAKPSKTIVPDKTSETA